MELSYQYSCLAFNWLILAHSLDLREDQIRARIRTWDPYKENRGARPRHHKLGVRPGEKSPKSCYCTCRQSFWIKPMVILMSVVEQVAR